MAKSIDYTVAYSDDRGTVDLCKILFGGDGSYYLTAPYHPAERAIAAKLAVNYAEGASSVDLSNAEEVAALDDDERRLKVSHHPDGFLQFSGSGVRSGLDEYGEPKGIGVFSWPLTNPTFGPAFQLAFSDPHACGRASKGRRRTVVLPETEIEHMRRGLTGLTIIGHYFPMPWREFVYRAADGEWWINLLHPAAQAMKPLRVLLAPVDSEWAGFIGLEARPHGLPASNGEPSFVVTTATGNLRRNEEGELLGDQLFCAYPRPVMSSASLPSLNHPLPAPPYKAPPGTTEIMPTDAERGSEPGAKNQGH
jgi:hypothetical protein